jgi:hypothetical protein
MFKRILEKEAMDIPELQGLQVGVGFYISFRRLSRLGLAFLITFLYQ